ncbi:hypothetical protein BDN72DRAFT_86697 [Pluteus cervinus]|uniref:Uncharacterized protein n=1 Tax=Pluteus cervinus TaxID=181527 RepID=A0ACD3APL4_9AGAR|nr:hypothetical protein BDN72DRAFT_86697 [Pluteus cervinus]
MLLSLISRRKEPDQSLQLITILPLSFRPQSGIFLLLRLPHRSYRLQLVASVHPSGSTPTSGQLQESLFLLLHLFNVPLLVVHLVSTLAKSHLPMSHLSLLPPVHPTIDLRRSLRRRDCS